MPIPRTRTNLGPRATEGTRLLWAAFLDSGQSQRRFAEALGFSRTVISNLLFGERDASVEFAVSAKDQLGIPVDAWTTPINPKFRIPKEAA